MVSTWAWASTVAFQHLYHLLKPSLHIFRLWEAARIPEVNLQAHAKERGTSFMLWGYRANHYITQSLQPHPFYCLHFWIYSLSGFESRGQQSKQRSPSHLFQLILGGHLVPPKPRDSYSLHSESWVSPMSKTSRLGGIQEVSKSDAGMTLMKLLSGSLVEIWNFSCCKYVKSLSCVHGHKLARLRPAREKTKILLRNIKTLPFSWARDWHWECTSLWPVVTL